jgi:hypothetical protein
MTTTSRAVFSAIGLRPIAARLSVLSPGVIRRQGY